MTKLIKLGAVLTFSLLLLISASACGSETNNVSDSGDDNKILPMQSDLPDNDTGSTNGDGFASGSNSGGSADNGAGGEDLDANVEPEALNMDNDMGITVSNVWFPIFRDISDLLLALGNDYEMMIAPSCIYEGEDKEFVYDGFIIFTNPNGDWGQTDIWYSIYIEDDVLSTARGISVGDSLEDVYSAYGSRYFWEGSSILTYSISAIEGDNASPCIQFIIRDNTVEAIEIYYPTNVS